MTIYRDEWGNRLGYCNACGEEGQLYVECCDDGEMYPFDDDEEEDE